MPVQYYFKDLMATIAVLTLAIVSIYFVATSLRRRQQNEMQKHLLDKFSSAKDFADFVQSPAGQQYVMSFTDVVTSPRSAIFSSIKTGCVLACVGVGFLAGSLGANAYTFRIGWICFSGGIGFLIAAAVSYFLENRMHNREKEP